MKKLVLLTILMAFFVTPAWARIDLKTVFESETISAGSSAAYALTDGQKYGAFQTLCGDISGSGFAEVYFEISGDGSSWVQPDRSVLLAYWHATAGPLGDGEICIPFTVPPCKQYRIVVAEKGTDSSVVVSATLHRDDDNEKAAPAMRRFWMELPDISLTLSASGSWDGAYTENTSYDMKSLGYAGYVYVDASATSGSGGYTGTYKTATGASDTFIEPEAVAGEDDLIGLTSALAGKCDQRAIQWTGIIAPFQLISIAETLSNTVTVLIKPWILIER